MSLYGKCLSYNMCVILHLGLYSLACTMLRHMTWTVASRMSIFLLAKLPSARPFGEGILDRLPWISKEARVTLLSGVCVKLCFKVPLSILPFRTYAAQKASFVGYGQCWLWALPHWYLLVLFARPGPASTAPWSACTCSERHRLDTCLDICCSCNVGPKCRLPFRKSEPWLAGVCASRGTMHDVCS